MFHRWEEHFQRIGLPDFRGFPDSSVGKDCLQCRWSQFNSWVRKICWRRDRLLTPVLFGFPCGSTGKESACNVGNMGSIPGLGRCPGEGKGSTLVLWPGEFHELYSPWSHKELDTTERLLLSLSRFHSRIETVRRSVTYPLTTKIHMKWIPITFLVSIRELSLQGNHIAQNINSIFRKRQDLSIYLSRADAGGEY